MAKLCINFRIFLLCLNMVSSSDILKIRAIYSGTEQREFFMKNLSQQFRNYYIGVSSFPNYYKTHNDITIDINNVNDAITIAEEFTSTAQQAYFEDFINGDISFLIKGYYIAQGKSDITNYFSPGFQLNLKYEGENVSSLNGPPVSLNSDASGSLKDHIKWAKYIIEDIIVSTDAEFPTIEIIEDTSLSNPNILGWADVTATPNPQIGINSQNLQTGVTGVKYNLNGSRDSDNNLHETAINVIVLVHEILHILGIGTHTEGWHNNISNFFYTGIFGFQEYKKLLQDIGYDITGLSGIPIENHFGAGTQHAHFEEGLYENFSPEIRKNSNNIVHPSIPTEIMSGFLDDIHTSNNDPWYSNYISKISLGILQDIGFGVNYDSIYVQNPPADQIYTNTSASQNLVSKNSFEN